MPLSPSDWRQRFIQQAGWTQDIRHYLYERAGLQGARRVLDVGCGTGALLPELESYHPDGEPARVVGLDLNSQFLSIARVNVSRARLVSGDALDLPFATASFDLVLCHFLLLWVADPARVLGEMRRVTRRGGSVLALAEPDYGGRIDYPPEFAQLGRWQEAALRLQGADPGLGRRLRSLFSQAGFSNVLAGVTGGQWTTPPSQSEWQSEWDVLLSDLKQISAGTQPAKTDQLEEQVRQLRLLDAQSWQTGERVLFVPTFYAWGSV